MIHKHFKVTSLGRANILIINIIFYITLKWEDSKVGDINNNNLTKI
jgi:hypothetical protein